MSKQLDNEDFVASSNKENQVPSKSTKFLCGFATKVSFKKV